MTVIVTMILLMFGLDPLTGRRPKITVDRNMRHKRHHHKRHHRHHHRRKDPEYLQTDQIEKRKGRHLRHGRRFNSGYDEDKTSAATDAVMTDMVQKRTNLDSDPLQQK